MIFGIWWSVNVTYNNEFPRGDLDFNKYRLKHMRFKDTKVRNPSAGKIRVTPECNSSCIPIPTTRISLRVKNGVVAIKGKVFIRGYTRLLLQNTNNTKILSI